MIAKLVLALAAKHIRGFTFLKVFDVKNSMNSKNSYGGTSSNNIKKMIKKYKKDIK